MGRTGLEVSRLGVAAGYGVPAAAVEKAYHEHGVNYFYWGQRKAGMRDALRRLVKTEREKLVIAIQSYDHIGWWIRGSVEKGLRALGIDHADVLILGAHKSQPWQKVMDGALELRDKGRVHHIALSGHSRRFHGTLAQAQDSPIDILMVRYSAAHRGAETEVFPLLPDQNRVGITTYTATRWGRLLKASKMPPGEKPLTAAECYRFVLTHPAVDLCMTGPASGLQMDEALAALDQGPLTDEELERVRRIGDHVHG